MTTEQYLSRAVEVDPDDGHSKYMYLGQLCEGEESVKNFLKGIEILEKQLAKVCPVVTYVCMYSLNMVCIV